MRKLISILLIVAIACAEVDTTPKTEESKFKEFIDLLDLDLDSVELFGFGNFFDGFGGIFEDIWDEIQSGIEWLKEEGIWDTIVSVAKTAGKYAATHYCSEYLSPEVCKPVIDGISKAF